VNDSTMIGVHSSMESRADTRSGRRGSAMSKGLLNPSRVAGFTRSGFTRQPSKLTVKGKRM